MSLVNKMLRDLDARRAGNGGRAALPAAVTPLAARQEPGRTPPALWLGTLMMAAAVGVAAWFAVRTDRPEVPEVARQPAPPALVPAEPVAPMVLAPPSAGTPLPPLRMAEGLSQAPAMPPPEAPPKAATATPKLPPPPAVDTFAPRPPVVALPRIPASADEARIDKQVRLPSAAERAEIAYRRGVLAQRQGNVDDAVVSYRAALDDQAEHAAARQSLAAVLIERRHFDEAEELLRKGTELGPVRLASTLALARLKVERNQVPAALELLQKNAASGEHSAEFQGFAGALLNRAGRAVEAVEHYRLATRLAPGEGRWWAGLGIALEAAGKAADAREAYQKARVLPGLPADLAQHVEQRLRQ